MNEFVATLRFEGMNISVRVSQTDTKDRIPVEITFDYGFGKRLLSEWNDMKTEINNEYF